MSEKETKERKTPTTTFAVVSFLVIIVVLVVMINIGVNTALSVFIGAVVACCIALYLRIPWTEIEGAIKNVVATAAPTLLIVIMVGILVGIWMAGGTVPALMYYGMKIIAPQILVPLAFVLCGLTSLFTGTSFGCIATMGLAMVGISITTDIPVALVVGAVVCGAWFGDKLSPLSDTTNMTSGVTKVPLYSHIGSMTYSTLPAALIALVMFTVAGLMYSSGGVDTSQATLICETLEANFNLNLLLLLPALLVLLVSAFRMPAILGMALTIVVSVVFAMVSQGVGFVELMTYAYSGFTIETGVDVVDPMLNRGGISSMTELLITFIIASVMGGIITVTGILDVIAKNVLLKAIKNKTVLVTVTLIYGYIVNFLTAGGQIVSIVVTGQTFEEAYKKLNVSSRVLSRTIEDCATLSAPIVPWGVATIYVMSVLGVGLEYIAYCWFIYLVPIVAIVLAVTGWGMWTADEKPMWNKKEKKAKEA